MYIIYHSFYSIIGKKTHIFLLLLESNRFWRHSITFAEEI